jgi:UDP-GlcNAc:undecaprenyl-phosphate/decaprenyl-phosphate GlcNAc-1-phosphate transferase
VRFSPLLGPALPYLIGAFVAAALLALILTPLVRRVALHVDAVDQPDHRRVNVVPIPRGGGVAVAAAFMIIVVAFIAANAQFNFLPTPISIDVPSLAALLLGGTVAVVFGVLDDYLDLRARWQFAGQLVLAAIAIGLGVTIDFLSNPFGPGLIRLDTPFAIGFTVLWVVGMINSINFIDGLDGLSSGVVFIAAVTLGLISLTLVSQPFVAVLCFTLAGALLGFLRYNFYPASVFVGTSGVMFMGFTLAVLSILGTAKIAVALLVLAVPIIDAFWIIVRRLAQGRSPFSPDRGHLHHRLLDVGLSHRQTVVLIYGICVGLGLLSLLLSGAGQVYAFLGVFVVIGLALFALSRMDLGGPDEEAEGDPETGVGPAPLDLRQAREARGARESRGADEGPSPAKTSRTG